MGLEALASELERLSDRHAIVDTVTAYATALDTRDWDLLASLFVDDATWVYGGARPSAGRDRIVESLRTSIERLDATQHLLGNHVVRVHGDVAEHSCYYQAHHQRAGTAGGDAFLAGGRYDDRFRRTPATTIGSGARPRVGGSSTAR